MEEVVSEYMCKLRVKSRMAWVVVINCHLGRRTFVEKVNQRSCVKSKPRSGVVGEESEETTKTEWWGSEICDLVEARVRSLTPRGNHWSHST